MAVSPIDVLAASLLYGVPCIETIPGTEVAGSGIQGRGLFARRAWSRGDLLGTLDGQIVDVTRHPGVIDALEWNALSEQLLLVRPVRTSYGFMNHCTAPNVAIDVDGRTMRAGRAIAPGDELTLDYFAQPVPAAYLTSAEAAALRAIDFVPADFEVPTVLEHADFRLTPLGPEHNTADYAAWTSSVDHIRATPGFAGRSWPAAMTLEDNQSDLEEHYDDFQHRRGFTYTVLDRGGDVIGCVYIYPPHDPGADADVRSWVREDRRDLDRPLYDAVTSWLAAAWPFGVVDYAARGSERLT